MVFQNNLVHIQSGDVKHTQKQVMAIEKSKCRVTLANQKAGKKSAKGTLLEKTMEINHPGL